MVEFQKFKKIFNDNIYSLNKLDVNLITSSYNNFTNIMIESEKETIEMIRASGLPVPDNIVEIVKNKSDYLNTEYYDIMIETLERYLEETYKQTRFDNGGICLKSQLIGKACQMIHNEDMLGVIRGIDEEHPRYLFVDFLEDEEVKIDIDELIISEQKK